MSMDKADLRAMDPAKLEDYQLNCETYEQMARNMMSAAYELDGAAYNSWVFGCSYFPDSVFTAIEDYREPINSNKESVTSRITEEQATQGYAIFDRTTVDMTRPFSAQCLFINRGFGGMYFTLIQYLD